MITELLSVAIAMKHCSGLHTLNTDSGGKFNKPNPTNASFLIPYLMGNKQKAEFNHASLQLCKIVKVEA